MDNNAIDRLVGDGFSFAPPEAGFTELALLSLRIALEAFFSTYHSVKHYLTLFENPQNLSQEQINDLHTSNYRKTYAETIVHFQHFAELVCKDFLRKDHPLLSVDASSKPVILHKLLHSEKVSPTEWEGLKSIEFSDVLVRLRGLHADKRLPPELAFFAQCDYSLQKMNILRNRIWHRGTFVLRYQALDQFISGGVLPFVDAVLALPEYANKGYLWRFPPLACGFDPFATLIADARAGNYDIGKFAFLKELLRAAYHNPLQLEQGFGKAFIAERNARIRQRAEQLAESRNHDDNVAVVRTCPVCGVHSLVLYTETEVEGDPTEPDNIWSYTNAGECLCCSFAVDNSLKNPRDYGLDEDDYWFAIN